MDADVTVARVMEQTPALFLPEKAQGVEAVIQYRFTGDQAGEWVMTISGGACQVAPGTAPNPKLTITASAQDYVAIATGKLDAMSAFAAGKLKLQGDLPLAMKLMGLFKRS
ncbi:MAG: SCP2 sterol-binding domain-containing protein [Anaerolineales bacterium]